MKSERVVSVGIDARSRVYLGGVVVIGAILAGAGAARGQCAVEWSNLPALAQLDALGNAAQPGVNGPVEAILPDAAPGASGADADALIAAGSFTVAGGTTPASRVARWDGRRWTALGDGLNGDVFALARLGNGQVVAGGSFTASGDRPMQRVARWDGQAWHEYAPGLSFAPTSLAVLPDGRLLAGRNSGSATSLQVFDGTAWSVVPIAVPVQSSPAIFVMVIAVSPSGEVLVGGASSGIGTPGQSSLRGTSLFRLTPAGLEPVLPVVDAGFNRVDSIAFDAAGEPVISGDFLISDAVNAPSASIARRIGGVWTGVRSGGAFNAVGLVLVRPDGTLASLLSNASTSTPQPGVSNSPSIAISRRFEAGAVLASGKVVVGGSYVTDDGHVLNNISVFSDSNLNWRVHRPLTTTLDGEILTVADSGDGSVVLGGSFERLGQTALGGLARLVDGRLEAMPGAPGLVVQRVVRTPTGRLWASAVANPRSSVSPGRLLRWTGSTWEESTIPTMGSIRAIAELPGERTVIGGRRGIGSAPLHEWNGSTWVSATGVGGTIEAMLVTSGGDLIVGGQSLTFINGGSATVTARGIMRRVGGQWQTMGAGLANEVLALAELPSGEIVAAGSFLAAANPVPGQPPYFRVARWNGSAWLPMDPSGLGMDATVRGLRVLSDGSLIATGDFITAGEALAYGAARWNGAAWRPLGEGLLPRSYGPLTQSPWPILEQPDGSVLIAGTFSNSGARATGPLVRARSAKFGCSAADIANADGLAGTFDACPDRQITNGDFFAFFSAFFADEGDPARLTADIADADGLTPFDTPAGGPDGAVTNADFTAFFAAFFAGCPG